MKLVVAIIVCAVLANDVVSSQDVMKNLMLNYGKAMEECKKEQNLPDSVQHDFMNFWKEDHVLSNRFTGCAILCLSTKLNLIDESGKLHHGNAMDFAKTHGADETMAKTLADLVHSCEKTVPEDPDKCITVLEVAKCFKAGVHKLDWAPNMELIVGEILAEV